MKKKHFVVVGTDRRLAAAARTLSEAGMTVSFYERNDGVIRGADALLLPLPMTRDGIHVSNTENTVRIADILASAPQETAIFAGKTDGFSDARLIDYAKNDFFERMNALPTAEGTLAIVLAETEITVCGMRVGITGFGRVARAVAYLFHAVGADVTVFARREEVCTEAERMGYHAPGLAALDASAGDLDVLINTVPHRIITAEVISHMEKDALIVDLASMPGGVDFDFARDTEICAIHALALPGKYSPKTAGAIVGETVLSLLSNETYRGDDRS
ncbi:MAG: dipicolinic acid synthetase [Clostridia bacterium]|nr:dipicolinic acid synthetase [Clostridia bacterium]